MVIKVKYKDTILKFDDWKCGDSNFIWYRSFINDESEELDDGNIVLLQFNGLWSVRFFDSALFSIVPEFYKLIYSDSKRWSNASEAKEDVDKFLHRINSLKVFL
jgi:hypothetical protein